MGLGLQNKDDEDQARLWSFVGDWLSKFYSHYRAAAIQLLTRRHLSLTSAIHATSDLEWHRNWSDDWEQTETLLMHTVVSFNVVP